MLASGSLAGDAALLSLQLCINRRFLVPLPLSPLLRESDPVAGQLVDEVLCHFECFAKAFDFCIDYSVIQFLF